MMIGMVGGGLGLTTGRDIETGAPTGEIGAIEIAAGAGMYGYSTGYGTVSLSTLKSSLATIDGILNQRLSFFIACLRCF